MSAPKIKKKQKLDLKAVHDIIEHKFGRYYLVIYEAECFRRIRGDEDY